MKFESAMNRRLKVYFLHTELVSYVSKDLDIIRSVHEIRVENNYRKPLKNFLKNVRGVVWSNVVFCWRSSINFLPAIIVAMLLRKKVVIIVGGHEVVANTDLNYGNMRPGVKSFLVRWILKMATKIICISKSNFGETVCNAGINPKKIALVYHGFRVPDTKASKKEPLVITVGGVSNSNLKRKGLEDFVKVARFFPDVRFVLIGQYFDESHLYLREQASANVEITGYISESRLNSYFRKAKVYVQASRHEGFGCSLAEAMLHFCVPVVTNVFALPEVVGNAGFLAEPENMDDLKKKIQQALNSNCQKGIEAREQIVTNFPLGIRKARLLEVIKEVAFST